MNDCTETNVSCIPGWWNADLTSGLNVEAWAYYDDLYDCTVTNNSVEACGGERGMLIALTTGAGTAQPMTANPFLGLEENASYLISFKALFYYTNVSNNVVVELWGSNTTTITSSQLIARSNVVDPNATCTNMSIGIINEEDVNNLVSFPYIFFKTKYFGLSPAELTIFGIVDDFSACTLASMEISTDECGQLCVEFVSDCQGDCDVEEYNDPDLDDCYMSANWLDEDEVTIYEDCYFPFIGDEKCCFTPPSYGTYFAEVYNKITINGSPVFFYSITEVDYKPCTTYVVSSNETWDANDWVAEERFELITVNAEKVLTIEGDLTLEFCETGKLVINPGGTVILNGILTSYCDGGWLGVEAQGDGNNSQYPVGHLHRQARIFCNEGSRIEYAKTAVKLYGPTSADAGGMIFADGATFLNNNRGLDFAPYVNFYPYPQNQKAYRSSIRNCTFDLDGNYQWPSPLTQHIKMNSVFGLNILGSYFGNGKTPEFRIYPQAFGTGILAIDSYFNVGPTAQNIGNEPCIPPCTIDMESKFYGLGIGISVGRRSLNRPFQVYNSIFENCFFGIANEGVNGANILYNEFKMGSTHELPEDEDQLGISLSGYQMITNIEENTFIVTEGNADFTLGIVANNMGEMDNEIRRNTFNGLSIGNEAFNRNAQEDMLLNNTGLHYLCNDNINVQGFDFTIPVEGSKNFIRHQQGVLGQPAPVSSGNTFSRTGEDGIGDFTNEGERLISYYQNPLGADEVLEEYTDATILPLDLGEPQCEETVCMHPCIATEDFSDEVGYYNSNLEDYSDALSEDEFEEAAYYLSAMHKNLSNITRFIESDTSGFNRDSLRKWYRRHAGVTGELLLAGDYFDAGLTTLASNTIDSIPIRFTLGDDQELDIARVGRVYDIISARSIYSLTSTDIDSLNLFANEFGASYSLARSILTLLDTVFTPRYYMPGELTPRSSESEDVKNGEISQAIAYPNPTFSSFYVEVPSDYPLITDFELINLDGQKVLQAKLVHGINKIEVGGQQKVASGIFLYRIFSESKMMTSGKILKLE